MRCARSLLYAIAIVSIASTANAVEEKQAPSISGARHHHIDIPSLNLAEALNLLAKQTEALFLFPYDIAETRSANAVTGEYTILEALEIILQDSGLASDLSKKGVVKIYVVDGTGENNDGRRGMNTKKNLLASTIAFFVGAGGVSSGLAQESGAGQEEQAWVLEEIVVTASKRGAGVNVLDVPFSIAAMTGETIENSGIQNISDLSFAVPNLSVWETGPGTQTITMRGVGNFSGSSSLVGVYLDEMPMALIPSAQLDLRTLDLERVEVLRGPQGTLYGQGSVGGTIRYITNNPSFDGFSGRVGVSLYDTEKGDWSQEYTGVVNVPVIDDKLAVRIAATYEDKAGWIDRPAVGDDNINDSELSNIRFKALFQPTDELAASLMAIRHRNEGGGQNVVNVGDVSDSQFQVAVDRALSPAYTDDYDLYNLTVSYDFGFATLVSSSSSVELDATNETSSEYADFSFNVPVTTEVLKENGFRQGDAFSQELRLSSNVEDKAFVWTVGAFYNYVEIEQGLYGDTTFDLGGFLLVIPGPIISPEESESIAFFADVAYTFGSLTLGAGTRYFEDDREVPGPTYNPKETFTNLSSKLYAAYALSDDSNLYLSIAEGFRSGGFNPELGVISGGAPDYEPEEVISYELGYKANLMTRLNVELALFFSEYQEFQTQSTDIGSGGFSTLNSGDAEIKGVEWNFQWAVSEGLTLGFNGNLTDAEFTDTGAGIVHSDGDPLDNVPEYNLSVNAHYQFQWSADVDGFARVDFNKQGENEVTDRSLGLVNPVHKSSAISFLNATIGAEWEAVSLEFFGRNLLDEDKATTASYSGLSPQVRPRTLGLKVNYDF